MMMVEPDDIVVMITAKLRYIEEAQKKSQKIFDNKTTSKNASKTAIEGDVRHLPSKNNLKVVQLFDEIRNRTPGEPLSTLT